MTTASQHGVSGRRRREIVTPEGLPLRFEVANLGERIAAFAVDMGIVFASMLALAIGLGIGGIALGDELVMVGLFLGFFVLRNFYFMGFELRWGGRTPGKRMLGTRVIDGAGGPLLAQAVIARNFIRELEVWIPLGLLFTHDVLFPGVDAPVRLLALAWVVALLAVPFVNADHMRLGDLIGGTLVVVAPRASLGKDVSTKPRTKRAGLEPGLRFTKAQLSHYGIYELQVLEDLLRRPSFRDRSGLPTVAYKIKVKIGWSTEQWKVDDRAFLRAFYAAQRAELERKMQFGVRKADKHDTA
jgi:uncharacterized RDD family membrane protein YckC